MVLEGITSILTGPCIGVIVLGIIVGIIFGAIPGLTATMAVALCLPLTFTMEPINGIAMLIALYVGGTSGGLISAILLKIPGTPSSVATVFDGGPMAARGEAGRALSIGVVYSFIGTVLSIVALCFIAPSLAKVALKFGPYEYFAICVFALTMLGSMVGDDVLKGLISAVFGICLSLVGVASIGGTVRFTFGIVELQSGFSLLAVLIGLFAAAEILRSAVHGFDDTGSVISYATKGIGFTFQEFVGQIGNCLRSALIGIGIGILPGIGSATSNIVAYTVAKQQSKHPEKFGTGIMDGIVASETSNNATIGGALIPLLTLGIPGDTVTAMILGGLTLHGITPGPLLFKNSGVLVYGIFAAFALSSVVMLIVMFAGMRGFVKVLKVPKHILLPIVFALCAVGAYGINHRVFDIFTTIAFGVIGYFMTKEHYPLAPLILGFVLGPIIETNLIRGLMYAKGDFFKFLSSPIAAVFLAAAVLMVAYSVYKGARGKKNAAAPEKKG